MSDIYNSNSIPHGSFVVAMLDGSTAKGNYVVENFNSTRPTTGPNRSNEVGEPNGWARVFGQVTASATVQLASTSTAWPANGWHFIEDVGFGNEKFVVVGVGQPYSQGDYHKATLDLMKDHAYTPS